MTRPFVVAVLFFLSILGYSQESKKIGEIKLSKNTYSQNQVITVKINEKAFVVFLKNDNNDGSLVCYNELLEEQWKFSYGQAKNIEVTPFYLEKENKVLVFNQTKLGGRFRLEAQYFNPQTGKESSSQLLITDSKKNFNIYLSQNQSHFLVSDFNGKSGVRSDNYIINTSLEVLYNKVITNNNFVDEHLSVSNNGGILIAGKTKEGKVLLDLHEQSSRKTLLEIPIPEDKKNQLIPGKVEENQNTYFLPVVEEVKKVGIMQLHVGVYDNKNNIGKIVKSEYFLPSYLNRITSKDFRGTKPEYSEKGYMGYKGVLGLKPKKMLFDDNGSFFVVSELIYEDGRNDLVREVPNDRNHNYSNQPFIKAKEVLISGFNNGVNSWNKIIYRYGYQESRKNLGKGIETISSSFIISNDRIRFILPDEDENNKQNCLFGALEKKTGDIIFRERFFHTKQDHMISKNLLTWLSPTKVVLFNCASDTKTNFFFTSFDFSEFLEW